MIERFNLTNGTDGGISPFETFKIKEKNKREVSNIKRKKVIQYDLDGDFIKVWNSITLASEGDDILRRKISSCCLNKNKSANGYMWRYFKENFCHKIKKYEYIRNISGLKKGIEKAKQFKKGEIILIRSKYENKEMKLKELSKKFNVSITSICNIVNKKTYKDYE